MYQIIESCLKLNLDYQTAIKVINLILKYYSNKIIQKDHTPVRIKKMDYRNYRRYVNALFMMSPTHLAFYTDAVRQNTPMIKKKDKDIQQLDNLLFLLNDTEKNKNVPYRKYKIIDTDDLVFRALIQIDKSYIF